MTDALHEILYCSVLAPGQPVSTVGQLVTKARSRNQDEAITGLLVFDGWRFCQHFEGPRAAVLKLMERISRDPRHAELRVVYEGALAQRRYQRFDMGLADPGDFDPIASIDQLDGEAALQRFLALRPGFDING